RRAVATRFALAVDRHPAHFHCREHAAQPARSEQLHEPRDKTRPRVWNERLRSGLAARGELRAPDRRLGLGFASEAPQQIGARRSRFRLGAGAIKVRRALLLAPAFERIAHRAGSSSAASIRARTSAESFGTTSSAFMFSDTCAARVAPVMTVLTFGLRAHHARASCATGQPKSAPI